MRITVDPRLNLVVEIAKLYEGRSVNTFTSANPGDTVDALSSRDRGGEGGRANPPSARDGMVSGSNV